MTVTAAAAAPDDESREITPPNTQAASLLLLLRFHLFGSVLFADVLDAHCERGAGLNGDRYGFLLLRHLYIVWPNVRAMGRNGVSRDPKVK